jgi:large subunit ribosomal protein L23
MSTAWFYDLIIEPITTEKTTKQKDEHGQISFSVDPKANRIEIKRSIEKVFNVKVASVRTLNIKGKIKRRGRILGKRKDYKKAVVTLMPGERIDFFEGV